MNVIKTLMPVSQIVNEDLLWPTNKYITVCIYNHCARVSIKCNKYQFGTCQYLHCDEYVGRKIPYQSYCEIRD